MNGQNDIPDKTPEEKKAEDIKKLGAKLKELREAQGFSLDDAWEALKIQKKYITAIEAGTLDKLPKGPFCRSFLKQYCEYLKAEDLWEKYDKLTGHVNEALKSYKKEDEEASYTSTPKVFRHKSYVWIYLIVVVCIGAAAWITWQYRGDIRQDATTPVEGGTAPVVESQRQAEQQQKAAAVLPPAVSADISPDVQQPVDLGWMDGKAPAAKVPAAQGVSGDAAQGAAAVKSPDASALPVLVINPKGTIWLKATSGSKTFFEGILKPGETKEFSPEGDSPLRIRYGNPVKTSASWMGAAESMAGDTAKPITRYYWTDGQVTETGKKN